jgi:hypothetical protein
MGRKVVTGQGVDAQMAVDENGKLAGEEEGEASL